MMQDILQVHKKEERKIGRVFRGHKAIKSIIDQENIIYCSYRIIKTKVNKNLGQVNFDNLT